MLHLQLLNRNVLNDFVVLLINACVCWEEYSRELYGRTSRTRRVSHNKGTTECAVLRCSDSLLAPSLKQSNGRMQLRRHHHRSFQSSIHNQHMDMHLVLPVVVPIVLESVTFTVQEQLRGSSLDWIVTIIGLALHTCRLSGK